MLRAYFDDSGTHAGSPVVVMGGLIGTCTQWERFEDAWAAKLARPLPHKPPLKMFHAAPCKGGWGEFEGYNHGERDWVTKEFRDIIINSDLISTASAIDRAAWDELIQGPIRNVLGDALEACFGNCIDRTIMAAKESPDGDKIAVVFDRGIESQRLRDMADLYMRPLANPRIVSVTFSKVEQFLPLQGADMAATETYWSAQEWLYKKGPRVILEP